MEDMLDFDEERPRGAGISVAKMKMGRRALLEPSQVQDPFGSKNPSSAPNAEEPPPKPPRRHAGWADDCTRPSKDNQRLKQQSPDGSDDRGGTGPLGGSQ